MRALVALLALSTPGTVALAKDPDCTRVERWPAKMAVVHLKNAGLIDSERIDLSKTSVVRLASEKVGEDLYRQVHRIQFVDNAGAKLDVITVSEASHVECSMSGVDVFVVARHLGPR